MPKLHLKSLLGIVGIISILLILTISPVLAQEPVDISKFPGLSSNKYGLCELENVCDPNSPNYDPSQLYGPEGTRFGPPGKGIKDSSRDYDKDDPFPGDADYGTALYSGKSVECVYATQKINTSISLNDTGDFLYAPTLLPPDYCRLETLASYHYNGSSTEKYWRVFCHSTSTWGQGYFPWSTQMNSTFCTRYAPGNTVVTQVLKSGSSTWSVYLFDWIDHQWDFIVYSTGNSKAPGGYGWDAWEEYGFSNDWPDLPEIRSYVLMVEVSNQWYLVTSTYGWEHDNTPGNFPYDYDMNNNFYDWYVGP